jgi:tetratricopeptide (TPR) repeat protein
MTENNRLADAQEHYLALLKQDPHNVGAHLGLGVVHRKGGRYKEALAHYEQAREADPHNRQVYYNLGLLYDYCLDDPAKAKACYDRYLELNGDPRLVPEPEAPSAASAPRSRPKPTLEAKTPSPPGKALAPVPDAGPPAEVLLLP